MKLPHTSRLQETHIEYKDTWQSEKMENIYHVNTKQKKARMAMLLSGNVDFRAKNISGDEDIPW